MVTRSADREANMAPHALDRLVLKLGAESGLGGEGKPLGTVLSVGSEHGFTDADIRTAIEILWKREWLRCEGPHRADEMLEFADTRIATTVEGKDRLRRLQATAQFNVRPPARLIEELRRLAHQGESATSLAVRALEEWVRMERFPGVDFRWSPSGRQPHVTGTGLTVWEIHRVWLDHEESLDAVREHYPHLASIQIQAGVAYAREYQDEMPPGWGEKPPFAREVRV